MRQIARLVPERTVFILCDLQERSRLTIYGFDELVLTINKILKVAKVLNIPVIVAEHNPRVMGPTVHEIDLTALGDLHMGTIPKCTFSMMPCVKDLLDNRRNIDSVVLFGIESHLCILQTALDFLEQNYHVHVLADGVSSRNREEVPIALAQIQQAGGYITTSETVVLQFQQTTAKSPQWKSMFRIMKEEEGNTAKAVRKLVQFRSARL